MFLPIVLSWMAVINAVTFVTVWRDKRIARKRETQPAHAQTMRVKERTMFSMGALGGVIGLFAGMYRFRHKTRKTSFLLVAYLILILNAFYWYLIVTELILPGM